MSYRITVTHEEIVKAVYRKLGSDRAGDLMEEHCGAADKFAHIAFPSIVLVTENPAADGFYVENYTFEFADESEAIHFRMTV